MQRVFVCYYKQRLHCLFHLYVVIFPLFQLIESPITAKGRQPCSHILFWDDGRRRYEWRGWEGGRRKKTREWEEITSVNTTAI